MPLKSIKQYLEKRSVEELNITLLEQKNNIERQIQELNRINNIIKNKLDILQSYKSIELDKMIIEDMEEEYFVLSKTVKDKSQIFLSKTLCEHVSKSYQTNLYSGFGFGAIIEDKQIINSDYLNYSYFYTKIDTKIKGVDYFIKPKGKYLVFLENEPKKKLTSLYGLKKPSSFSKSKAETSSALFSFASSETLLSKLTAFIRNSSNASFTERAITFTPSF